MIRPLTEPEIPPGECALGCGNPVHPGSEYCADCAAMMAKSAARHAKNEQRQAAREERQRQLREIAERGCGCPSEAECRLNTTDWSGMAKAKADKAYAELSAACARMQRLKRERLERENERYAQQQAAEEDRRRESRARWAAVTLPLSPSPLLTSLRRTVLAVRHDRCPKWRFRLAPDLVVQIQPRPAERRDQFELFSCIAIQAEGVAKEYFASRRARTGMIYVEFGIVADPENGGWRTAPHAFSRGADALMARLVDLLPKLEVINPHQLFSDACMICGKALVDPASMARMIGPECAGTASLDAGLIAPRPAPQANDLFSTAR